MADEVRRRSEEVALASREISSGNQNIAEAAMQQAAGLAEVSWLARRA